MVEGTRKEISWKGEGRGVGDWGRQKTCKKKIHQRQSKWNTIVTKSQCRNNNQFNSNIDIICSSVQSGNSWDTIDADRVALVDYGRGKHTGEYMTT